MVAPFEALPLDAVGRYRGCSFAALNDAAFRPSCPCVVCAERQSAGGHKRDLVYAQEPLVLLDAGCLCHGAPVHAEVCDVQVQTDSVELLSVAVQVETDELNLQVVDSEVEVEDVKVDNVQVKKPSQSLLRRQRRKKTKQILQSKADAPLLPFPPRR